MPTASGQASGMTIPSRFRLVLHTHAVRASVATLVLAAALAGCATPGGPAAETGPGPVAGPGQVPSPVAPTTERTSDTAWLPVPEGPLTARHSAVGAWVGNRFVVVGGMTSEPCADTADCEITAFPRSDGAAFDPESGAWTRIADAPAPVAGQVAVIGDRMFVMTVVSGPGGTEARSFLAYDPRNDAWEQLRPAPPVWGALVTAGDHILSIAPSDENTRAIDAVFDPSTGAWRELPDDPLGPSYDRQAVWLGDRLLLTAKDLVENPGAAEPSLSRLAVLEGSPASPESLRWRVLPDSDIIGYDPMAVAGRVVFPDMGSADGGAVDGWGRSVDFGGILDPATLSWRPLPEPPAGPGLERYATHTRTSLRIGDRALVAGHLLLDPVTEDWLFVPVLPGPDRTEGTLVTNDDAVLLWGGAADGANRADGYLLRP
ncbi:hypothetical protein ACFDTO_05750 [Microbacteriaceae bacterium 4G12]